MTSSWLLKELNGDSHRRIHDGKDTTSLRSWVFIDSSCTPHHIWLVSPLSWPSCCAMTPWWCHQMETFSALLAICARNSPVPGEFPTQRPVTRSFDVFFDLRLNKRLSKQWWGWWFETLSRPFWRHCNDRGNLSVAFTNRTQRQNFNFRTPYFF